MRTKRDDIETLGSALKAYKLYKNQCFYETPKAYEIWETKPLLHRVIRISKSKIGCIILK